MTSKNSFVSTQTNFGELLKRMAIGGTITLILILLFLYPVNPNPLWGKFWIVRPLIIVPLAGATGGACNYFILRFGNRNGWNKFISYFLSFVVFIFGLWIGTILGLDGTLWD